MAIPPQALPMASLLPPPIVSTRRALQVVYLASPRSSPIQVSSSSPTRLCYRGIGHKIHKLKRWRDRLMKQKGFRASARKGEARAAKRRRETAAVDLLASIREGFPGWEATRERSGGHGALSPRRAGRRRSSTPPLAPPPRLAELPRTLEKQRSSSSSLAPPLFPVESPRDIRALAREQRVASLVVDAAAAPTSENQEVLSPAAPALQKKKRGRPRKYPPGSTKRDVRAALTLLVMNQSAMRLMSKMWEDGQSVE